MDVYEAIAARKTIRDFDGRPIDQEILTRFLAAGLKAPCGGMQRTWEFVIVNGPLARLEMLRGIDERTAEDAARMVDQSGIVDPLRRDLYVDVIPKQRRMLLTAGALVVPCFRQTKPLLQPDSLLALDPLASVWCCIENILIAAASEGIFGVTAVFSDPQMARAKSVLGIPAGYEVPCLLGLGYPARDAKRARQVEIDPASRIHLNHWQGHDLTARDRIGR